MEGCPSSFRDTLLGGGQKHPFTTYGRLSGLVPYLSERGVNYRGAESFKLGNELHEELLHEIQERSIQSGIVKKRGGRSKPPIKVDHLLGRIRVPEKKVEAIAMLRYIASECCRLTLAVWNRYY